MNEPRFATGSRVKVRVTVGRASHPGKNPHALMKGKLGTVRGYGGWKNGGAATNGGLVDHEYVVKTEDGAIVVMSESWLEGA
jgi:hypothetical protein